MKVNLTAEQQQKVIAHISTTRKEYETKMKSYLNDKAEEYEEYTSFRLNKKNARDTDTKVNKAYEAVEKRAGKLTSREPIWNTSVRPDIEYKLYQDAENLQDNVDKIKKTSQITEWLLTDTWKRWDVVESVERMAKDFASLWVVIGKTTYKYKPQFDEEEVLETIIDENGEEVVTKKKENVGKVKKMPTIDNVSIDRVFYDIDYKDFDDLPCVIEYLTGIRASHILNDSRYDNLDKLSEIVKQWKGKNSEELKDTILNITGVTINEPVTIDETSLYIWEYYWYFNLTDDPKKEKLYKFCVVNDLLVIQAQEIKTIPYCMVRLFADKLSLRANGIVRPVIGLQKDFNFKRAAKSQYIKQWLNRKYIVWPWAWFSLRDLAKPDGIVMTNQTMETVQANFMEIPHREINWSIRNDNMDDQREMQSMMFSIDTTQPSAQWSTIDTATGSKIEFYENNVVINKARIRFENFLAKLWEKILYAMVENMSELDNLYTRIDNELVAVHKSQIEKSLNDMEISIEMGSTNYAKEKERRDDLIAINNILLQAKQSGSNVDVDKNLKNLLETFKAKDVDSYFKPNMEMLWLWQESQNISWQSTPKTLQSSMNKWTGDQTMDFTNDISWTSINLPT